MSGLDDIDRAGADLASLIHRLRTETRTQGRAGQAAYRSVELTDGPVSYYDEAGVERLQVGAVGEDGEFTTLELNGNTPPTPSIPDIEQVPGGFNVIWDGTFEGANRPLDLRHVEIHIAPDIDDEPTDTNQVGEFGSDFGGTYYWTSDASLGMQFVTLVAINNSGVESDPSEPIEAEGLPVEAIPLTDGLAPAKVGALRTTPAVRAILLEWSELVNADPTDYLIWGSSQSGFEPEEENFLGFTAAGQWLAQNAFNPVTGSIEGLNPGVNYYFRVAARDADGTGVVSDESGGVSPIKIGTPDIAPYSITGESIANFALPVIKFNSTRHAIY